MNILYLCDEYPPGRHGGIGTAVQLLAREMVRLGHTVVVAGFYDWAYGGADEFEDEGVKVYRFRRGLASARFTDLYALPVRIAYKLLNMSGLFHKDIAKSLKKYALFINELIDRHAIDIIEKPDFNDYIRFAKSYLPPPVFNRPTVVKLHGSLTHIAKGNNMRLPEYITRFERDVLSQATSVCAVSKYAAEKAKEYFGYDKPIEVLYNGINTERNNVGVNKKPGSVIFTGALTENKGIYQLMKAWNIVHAQMPEAVLSVFGKGPVMKVKSVLDKSAHDSVKFYGHVSRSELFNTLSESEVAIFPSYTENFAMGPMEAMLAKTAVIYTERTSGPELIDDEVNGLLINPDDPAKIATRICHMLTHPEVRNKFADRAYMKIREKFDISVIAQQHIAFYKKVLSQVNND